MDGAPLRLQAGLAVPFEKRDAVHRRRYSGLLSSDPLLWAAYFPPIATRL